MTLEGTLIENDKITCLQCNESFFWQDLTSYHACKCHRIRIVKGKTLVDISNMENDKSIQISLI